MSSTSHTTRHESPARYQNESWPHEVARLNADPAEGRRPASRDCEIARIETRRRQWGVTSPATDHDASCMVVKIQLPAARASRRHGR